MIIHVSADQDKLSIDFVYEFLIQTYWAKNRSKEDVIKSIENSHCYGLYADNRQIGFARLVTDKTIFAYFMDVFVLPEFQGLGYGKTLMEYILEDPELSTVTTWYLRTEDAQEFYRKIGFVELRKPQNSMEILLRE